MKRFLVTMATGAFILLPGIAILSSCNPSQEQRTQEKIDSMQREMEAEMDTAGHKIDSIGDTIKGAADNLLDEAGKTLEEAGEKLKDAGNK